MDPRTFASDAPGSLHYDPAGYWTFHPYPLPPLFRWTDELVTALSAADRALAGLSARIEAGPPGFTRLAARVEAAASCRLSGLETGLVALLESEAGYPEDEDREDGEVQAGAYARALIAACERATARVLQLREIEAIHAEILPGEIDERWPTGEFRRGQTWIGPPDSTPTEAVFVPPPPEEMRTELESLAGYISREERLPPLVRLALIHYQFEVIHPFYDANGRVGRLLNALLLRRFGLLPGPGIALSAYLHDNQAAYDHGISRVSRENEFGAWIAFFLEGVRAACEQAGEVLSAHAEMRATYRAAVSGERTAGRLRAALDFALARPFFSVGQLNEGMSAGNFKSASRVVDRLERLGIVEETTGQARHRVFRLSEWVQRLGEIV